MAYFQAGICRIAFQRIPQSFLQMPQPRVVIHSSVRSKMVAIFTYCLLTISSIVIAGRQDSSFWIIVEKMAGITIRWSTGRHESPWWAAHPTPRKMEMWTTWEGTTESSLLLDAKGQRILLSTVHLQSDILGNSNCKWYILCSTVYLLIHCIWSDGWPCNHQQEASQFTHPNCKTTYQRVQYWADSIDA